MINLKQKYKNCIDEVANELINIGNNEIYSIILYGGIVRDGKPLKNWSDIDFLVILNNFSQKNNSKIGNILKKNEIKYQIRLDISVMYKKELEAEYLRNMYNSELLNVLSFRKNVSSLIYGTKPQLNISNSQEESAALYYVSSILDKIRVYLFENVYKPKRIKYKEIIPRLIRWTFSVIRASLRLFNIYSHPYQYSIPNIKKVFPDFDYSLLDILIKIRNDEINMEKDLIFEIEKFLEEFIPQILRIYNEKSIKKY